MRKFLVILLIATIACTTVEEINEANELDFSFLDDLILEKSFLKKVKHAFRGIRKGVGKLMKGVGKVAGKALAFLKTSNLLGAVISALVEVGKHHVNKFCSKLKHGSSLCSHGVDFLADKISKK